MATSVPVDGDSAQTDQSRQKLDEMGTCLFEIGSYISQAGL